MVSQVVIFHARYKDFIFDASTPEKVAEACLGMLRFNSKNGIYAKPIKPEHLLTIQERDLLSIKDEDLTNLPPMFREEIERAIKILRTQAKLYKKDHDKNLKWFSHLEFLLSLPFDEAVIKKVIENGETQKKYLATELIENRAEFDFEGFDFIPLDNPKNIFSE
jgi:hypothetical protein